jgi:hypothetical protein
MGSVEKSNFIFSPCQIGLAWFLLLVANVLVYVALRAFARNEHHTHCVCLECTSLAIKIASILSGASPLVGSW